MLACPQTCLYRLWKITRKAYYILIAIINSSYNVQFFISLHLHLKYANANHTRSSIIYARLTSLPSLSLVARGGDSDDRKAKCTECAHTRPSVPFMKPSSVRSPPVLRFELAAGVLACDAYSDLNAYYICLSYHTRTLATRCDIRRK